MTTVTPAGRVATLTVDTDRGRWALRGNEIRAALRSPGGELLYSTYFSVDVVAGARRSGAAHAARRRQRARRGHVPERRDRPSARGPGLPHDPSYLLSRHDGWHDRVIRGAVARPSGRAEPLRIGVVGAGAIAQLAHLPVLSKMRGVELVALCDNDRPKARALADRFDIPDVYTDIEDLLEADGLEAVVSRRRTTCTSRTCSARSPRGWTCCASGRWR